MSKQLAVRSSKELARPLRVLVPLIKKDLGQADGEAKRSFEHYAAAGGKLKEAKKQIDGRYAWGDWLRKNFNRASSQASRYMRAYEQMEKGKTYDSIKEMERKTAKGKLKGIPKNIRRIMEGIDVDVEELNETKMPEKAEVGLIRELMDKVVHAGYRAISLKLHPDKGGSNEAMRRLNLVRDTLLEFAREGVLMLHE